MCWVNSVQISRVLEISTAFLKETDFNSQSRSEIGPLCSDERCSPPLKNIQCTTIALPLFSAYCKSKNLQQRERKGCFYTFRKLVRFRQRLCRFLGRAASISYCDQICTCTLNSTCYLIYEVTWCVPCVLRYFINHGKYNVCTIQ